MTVTLKTPRKRILTLTNYRYRDHYSYRIILHELTVTSENSELGATKRKVEILHSEIQHTSNQRRFCFVLDFNKRGRIAMWTGVNWLVTRLSGVLLRTQE